MCFMFGANEEQVRRALGLTVEVEPEPAVQQVSVPEQADRSPASQRAVVCDPP